MLVSLSFFVFAEPDATMKANAYFEAEEYQKAIEAYQALLKEQGLGIKKEILTYNVGTAYLANHQYGQAIDHFFKVMEKEDEAPKYLIERTHFNLILSYLALADHTLDNLDTENPMSSIKETKETLTSAQEKYEAYLGLKYPYLTEGDEKPQELIDLKSSLKELNSKLKLTEQKIKIESLTFSKGLQFLLEQTDQQLFRLNAYLQKELPKDFKKYLLTKQHIFEKSKLPYWKRVEEIIQQQYEEAENEVLHKDKVAQKQDENFELQSNYRALFDQANNRHHTALDCLKENDLSRSRIEYAKAKLDLTLMRLTEQAQDCLEHCLKEKIALKESSERYEGQEGYAASLNQEIHHYNTMAYGLAHNQDERMRAFKNTSKDRKTFSKLDELRKVEELDLVHQLITRLKDRLEDEQNPTLDKLSKDYYLYLLAKVEPEEILLKIYERLKENTALQDQEVQVMDHQFFALLNRFEVQSQFSYDEAKNKRIHYAQNALPTVKEKIVQSELKEAEEGLKNILINWSFNRFMMSEIEKLKNNTEKYQDQILFSKADYDQMSTQNQEVLSCKDKLEEPESHQEAILFLEESFKRVEETSELALHDSFQNKTQKLLLKNASAWMDRMIQKLKTEKATSKEVLLTGIKEEKLSLEFVKQAETLNVAKQEDSDYFQALSVESQDYPISSVQTFEELFYDEESEATAKSGESTRNSDVLKYFKAGLVEAESALKLLSKDTIKWEDVATKQNLTIEYWQKALEAYGQKSKDQDSDQGQSNQGGDSQNQENQGAPDQKGDLEDASVAEMEQDEMDSSKDSSLRDILQKLQEMEQDDQISPKIEHKPKQGLRPW